MLKIIGKRYKLVRDKKAENCGLCDCNKQIITLKGDMPATLELDTIIHEIVHAIDYQMDLKMSERQVHGVGAGLAAVMIDNAKFIDYLKTLTLGE